MDSSLLMANKCFNMAQIGLSSLLLCNVIITIAMSGRIIVGGIRVKPSREWDRLMDDINSTYPSLGRPNPLILSYWHSSVSDQSHYCNHCHFPNPPRTAHTPTVYHNSHPLDLEQKRKKRFRSTSFSGHSINREGLCNKWQFIWKCFCHWLNGRTAIRNERKSLKKGWFSKLLLINRNGIS